MKVLIVDSIHTAFQDLMQEAGFTCDDKSHLSKEEIIKIIPEYDGLIIRSKLKLTFDILSDTDHLKFICRAGSGMENIDVDFAEAKGIRCFSAPEGNKDAVGEHCIGLLLTLFNNILRADAEVRNAIWKRVENRGIEIGGKTIGIIGYGNAGSALAKKLSGFDCKILAHDKYKSRFSNDYVTESSLEELFAECDIVSFHLPLTEETHHYADDTFFSQFIKPIYLINASRGYNVKTSDLVLNLKSGRILGACLDVLELESTSFEKLTSEDMGDDFNYLKNASNVVLSPHVAGWTHESHRKLSEILAQKVLKEFSALEEY
ncbi:MAG: hydroxyacid dehydrogenase [Flavobacteriales bacterium]|nr:hydroxyacid dehydrogenase [Flavobacteriales bacterium]